MSIASLSPKLFLKLTGYLALMQYFAMRTIKNFKVHKTVIGARPKFSKTTEGKQYMNCNINNAKF